MEFYLCFAVDLLLDDEVFLELFDEGLRAAVMEVESGERRAAPQDEDDVRPAEVRHRAAETLQVADVKVDDVLVSCRCRRRLRLHAHRWRSVVTQSYTIQFMSVTSLNASPIRLYKLENMGHSVELVFIKTLRTWGAMLLMVGRSCIGIVLRSMCLIRYS